MLVFPIKPQLLKILTALLYFVMIIVLQMLLFSKLPATFDGIFIALIFVGFFIPYTPFLDKRFNSIKRKQIIKKENYTGFQESLRTLSDNETGWLVNEIDKLEKYRHVGYLTIIILVELLLLLIPLGLVSYSHPLYKYIPCIIVLVVLSFTVALYCFRGDSMSANNTERDTLLSQYKKDLSDPVMNVKGNAIVEFYPKIRYSRNLDLRSPHYCLWVNNIMFQYPNLTPFLQSIKNGDVVSLEYSPHSRHVWREEKLASL